MSNVVRRWTSFISLKVAQYYYSSLASAYLAWRWVTTAGSAFRIKQRQQPRVLTDGYNHKHILLPSGISMHYVEAGDPSAPLMVMVHGYPEFWYSWRYQISHFKDRYRVVAIDQRGYGDSSKPLEITDYSVNLLAKDVDDIIHGLGYERAIVMAHDWGGIVAWRHAIAYPSSVHRLIMCNCPHPAAFGELLRTNEQQRASSWYMLFFQSARIPEAAASVDDFLSFDKLFWGKQSGLRNKANFTADDMEAWKYTFSKPDALKCAINYYRCLYQYPLKDNFKQKCKPKTLIVWGEADMFIVKEGAQLSVQWCDDATLHVIPGASHWVQQDEPTIVNQRIDEFLRVSAASNAHI